MMNAAQHMDAIYYRQRHIYDLSRRYFLLGRRQLQHALLPPHGGHVLEIGCGTGWNLISAARAYPDAHFYGLDISHFMLQTARQSLSHARLENRVMLAHADATRFDSQRLFGRGTFDRIFIAYSLSMIPDWRGVLSSAADRIGPDGSLHIVDFGQCSHLPSIAARGLGAWLARFDVHPDPELKAEITRLATRRSFALDFQHLYRDYCVLAKMGPPAHKHQTSIDTVSTRSCAGRAW